VNLQKLRKTQVHFSVDPEVVRSESQDLTLMSPDLSNLSSRVADAVVFPRDEEEVVKVVELALEEHVPIVPRGAGKNNIGGVVPLKGGIILDVSEMKYRLEGKRSIRMQPGAKYFEDKLTFNARVYPSTFREGVTVGGNFAGGCGGIGAFMYNRVWFQAEKVRIVNPRGKVSVLSADDVKVVAHAEGTTGVITELQLLKREWRREETLVLSFEYLGDALKFVERAYDDTYPIYHMTLRSPKASLAMEGETGVPERGWLLILAFPKTESIEIPSKASIVRDQGRLWERRDLFFGGIIWFHWKKYGKVFYATKDIPMGSAEDFLRRVQDISITQVEFLRGGVAHPFVVTLEEESFRTVWRELESYPGRNFDLHNLTINGRLDKDHLQKIIWYKRAFDKEDLFNPGKVKFGSD